jgi:hypothetical protein
VQWKTDAFWEKNGTIYGRGMKCKNNVYDKQVILLKNKWEQDLILNFGGDNSNKRFI